MSLQILELLICVSALLICGYFFPTIKNKKAARILGWIIVVISVFVSIQITKSNSPLYRMLIITTFQLFSMKLMVMIETYPSKPRLNFIQWLFFATGWFGMRPQLFETLISKPLNESGKIFIKGLARIVIGVYLLYISKWIYQPLFIFQTLSSLLMLIGLSFILHFGILNLSTALWRFLGVNVKELFQSPFKSKSLKEFWGRRWNIAFSEMTALIVYKPVKKKFGDKTGVIAAFLLSGLLHEVAISCPVNSGYGLPFAYFVIHALVMNAEDLNMVKKITQHKILSHVWVFFWLLVPLPLLFHHNFMQQVIVPLRDSIIGLI